MEILKLKITKPKIKKKLLYALKNILNIIGEKGYDFEVSRNYITCIRKI